MPESRWSRSAATLPAFLLLAGMTVMPARSSAQTPPDHTAFTEVLARIVEGPRVDYRGLGENRAPLDRYLESLGATSPERLAQASRNDQLAFWINAYNACMLRLVSDHYPIERGRTGFFGALRNRVAGYPDNSPWQIRDVFSRTHCHIAGARRSQDEIEHEIIRPGFEDPRIHFAVNCAAISCPILWPDAYRGSDLDAQLDRAVINLIATPQHFRLERGSPATLHLNKVLDWYSGDFGGEEGLKAFFAGYLSGGDAELLLRSDTRVQFFEYDWTLNDVER